MLVLKAVDVKCCVGQDIMDGFTIHWCRIKGTCYWPLSDDNFMTVSVSFCIGVLDDVKQRILPLIIEL